jgi:hypothetical protein
MTPERFRECLDITGFSTRGIAEMLGRPDRRIRRWSGGTIVIPDDVATWLEGMARYMQTHPPPQPRRNEHEEG